MKALILLTALLGSDPDMLARAKTELARLHAESDVASAKAEVLNAIDALKSRIDQHEALHRADNPVMPPALNPTPTSGDGPAVMPKTTVCQCLGYRENMCLCLKAGQRCHCTRTSGSVWAINADGSKTKTKAKADPQTGVETVATTPPPPQDRSVPYKATDGRYWWHDGSQWWNLSVKPVEGQAYGAFRFSGGKMVPNLTQAVPRASGHWEQRCYGSYCERVWVPN